MIKCSMVPWRTFFCVVNDLNGFTYPSKSSCGHIQRNYNIAISLRFGKNIWCQGLFLLYNASIGVMACMRSGHLHPTWILSWYHWYIWYIMYHHELYIFLFVLVSSPVWLAWHWNWHEEFEPQMPQGRPLAQVRWPWNNKSSQAVQPWTGPLRLRRTEEGPQ